VVLVYLGFLNADEMDKPCPNHDAWEHCLLTYAEGVVPQSVPKLCSLTSGGEDCRSASTDSTCPVARDAPKT
jgi:hypothetical protein